MLPVAATVEKDEGQGLAAVRVFLNDEKKGHGALFWYTPTKDGRPGTVIFLNVFCCVSAQQRARGVGVGVGVGVPSGSSSGTGVPARGGDPRYACAPWRRIGRPGAGVV